MPRRAPRKYWEVIIDGTTYGAVARTAGHAVSQCVRNAIYVKQISNQPKSTDDGGWGGVSVRCVGPALTVR